MKKLFYTMIIFFLSVGLIACKPGVEPKIAEDLTISIASETIVANKIEVHIIIPIELKSIDDLAEIMMNVASQTYEKHFDAINTKKHSMRLYFYSSVADYENNTPVYGNAEFVINKSLTEPGLELVNNSLTIE